jgi:Flp pilus assembly pilin Flp
MLQLLKNLHKEESGQDLIEYVLIAATLSVVAIAGSTALVTAINSEWTTIAGKLT